MSITAIPFTVRRFAGPELKTKTLGNGLVLYETIASEIVRETDNTPILELQERSLKAALENVLKQQGKSL